MSSLSEIYFNYRLAIEQAKQLDSIASNLTKAADNTLQDVLHDVHNAWKSDSSQQYIKKGEKIGEDTHSTVVNLRSIADTIRTIAERTKQAELEARRIANERQS